MSVSSRRRRSAREKIPRNIQSDPGEEKDRERKRERKRRLTRSSYRLLGALESPSNDPLFRALCYQPFREEHRGRWPPVLLFHGANERSAASRFDRDKRDRAPTRRCRTLSPSGRRRYVVRRVRVYGVCATWPERAAYPRSMRRPALIGSPIDFDGRTVSIDRPLLVFRSEDAASRLVARYRDRILRSYECPRPRWIARIG